MEKEYKCKYCAEIFEKPLLLAQHVKSRHKKAKIREKRGAEKEKQVEQINRTIEAIGILKGLQVSSNLSADEKKILGDVLTRMNEFLAYMQKR